MVAFIVYFFPLHFIPPPSLFLCGGRKRRKNGNLVFFFFSFCSFLFYFECWLTPWLTRFCVVTSSFFFLPRMCGCVCCWLAHLGAIGVLHLILGRSSNSLNPPRFLSVSMSMSLCHQHCTHTCPLVPLRCSSFCHSPSCLLHFSLATNMSVFRTGEKNWNSCKIKQYA